MDTTYPEIYHSAEICDILNKEPQLPIKPQEPKRLTQPIDPGEYDSDGYARCFWIFGMIFSIVGFYLGVSSEFGEHTIPLVFGSILGFIVSFFALKIHTWDKRSHEEKQRKYKMDIANYPDEVRGYEKEFEKYKEELISYEKKVADITSPVSLEKFRSLEIRNYLRNRREPAIIDIDLMDSIKIGASEGFFKEKLELQGFNLIEGKKIKAGGGFFYPDILIEWSGIYVDIEIDEPYAGNDGTPIHYIKEEWGFPTSIDEKRNEFFTKNGFEVIRFSEEQIFRTPNNCIQLISDFIEAILQGRKYVLPENSNFKTDKWTYEESMKMAYRRFRRTYVPEEYATYIDKEEQHSYQEILNELSSNRSTLLPNVKKGFATSNHLFVKESIRANITDKDWEKSFIDANGVRFSNDKKRLLKFPENSTIEHYIVPDGIEVICEWAFCIRTKKGNIIGIDYPKSIDFPASLKMIGDYSMGCLPITSLSLPDSVEYIGNYAFAGCSQLTQISLPNTCNFLGNRTFYNCIKLKHINIPISIDVLEDSLFAGCESLEKISIPRGVSAIKNEVFFGCLQLKTIHLPNTICKIENDAFAYCCKEDVYSQYSNATFLDRQIKAFQEPYTNKDILTIIAEDSSNDAIRNLIIGTQTSHEVSILNPSSKKYPTIKIVQKQV